MGSRNQGLMPPNNRRRDPRAEKIKDMKESLLPSTHRKGARDSRKIANRTFRRQTRMRFGDYEGPDDFTDRDIKRRREIYDMMQTRRNGDKLSIVRWSQQVTKDMDTPEDRYMYLKGILGDNPMGRHALGHCENWPDAEVPILSPGYNRPSYYRSWRDEDKERWAKVRLEFTASMERCITNGGLKPLNNAIKRAHRPARYRVIHYYDDEGREVHYSWNKKYRERYEYFDGHSATKPCKCKPRVLLGVHDLEAFIDEIFGTYGWQDRRFRNKLHPEWTEAAYAFLDLNV